MGTKPIALGIAAALLAVVAVVGVSGATDGRPVSGPQLYGQLVAAARAGDERAADYKRLLDEHMARGGLRIEDLKLPAEASIAVAHGDLQLRVRDSAPWGITISNRTVLDTPQALAHYRESRHAALAALGAADPGGDVNVVVSPSRSISVADFVAALTCPCAGEQLIVDVFAADGGWLMTSGRDLSGADISDTSAVEAAVLEQARASTDQFPTVDPSGLSARVRSLRLTLAADNALALAAHPDVLVVDPLTDIADLYAGEAAIVTVHNPPDAWEAYARLVLGAAIDSNLVQPAESEDN